MLASQVSLITLVFTWLWNGKVTTCPTETHENSSYVQPHVGPLWDSRSDGFHWSLILGHVNTKQLLFTNIFYHYALWKSAFLLRSAPLTPSQFLIFSSHFYLLKSFAYLVKLSPEHLSTSASWSIHRPPRASQTCGSRSLKWKVSELYSLPPHLLTYPNWSPDGIVGAREARFVCQTTCSPACCHHRPLLVT
jgi:hypothetical protein